MQVKLYDCNNLASPIQVGRTETTDSNGRYKFENLRRNQKYFVEFIKTPIANFSIEFTRYFDGTSDKLRNSDANPNNN